MEKEILLILGGLITIFSAIISTAVTYYFTKERERQSEWRKEKLKYYIEFVNSLSGIIEGESSKEGQKRFSKACNDLQLFAPKEVINALHKFRETIRVENPDAEKNHDLDLTSLIFAVRRDLNVKPDDKIGDWKAKLWSSGN